MLVFPLIYISVFFVTVKDLLSRNKQSLLAFIIFGLPIYTTTLIVLFDSGLGKMISVVQPLKELLVLATLGLTVWQLRVRFRPQLVDYCLIAYFCYALLYVFLPIGQYGVAEKIIAFKSSTFFVLVYFVGRFLNPREVYISKYFHYILILAIAATVLLFFEIIADRHFQTLIGYSDYFFYYYNQPISGNYGLTWTFEASSGLKRFASFFANPLEFSAATLIALAVIAGIYTDDRNRFRPTTFGITAIAATQFSILFALSRASLVSYFLMIYAYALITRKKQLLLWMHMGILAVVLYISFFLVWWNPDLHEFIYETVTFTNTSSVGHVIAWLDGIEAMVSSPLGLGLGESGRVAVADNDSIGGENQFIIIGVQTGIIALILYLAVLVMIIRTCLRWFPHLKGKEKKLCLALLLMKVGIVIPLLTSELETSMYISYLTWFFSGLFMNIIAAKGPLPVLKHAKAVKNRS